MGGESSRSQQMQHFDNFGGFRTFAAGARRWRCIPLAAICCECEIRALYSTSGRPLRYTPRLGPKAGPRCLRLVLENRSSGGQTVYPLDNGFRFDAVMAVEIGDGSGLTKVFNPQWNRLMTTHRPDP